MQADDFPPTRVFTVQELLRYDGEAGPMYIAHQGIVYDVSDCPKWRSGLHENQHFPGQDLTGEIPEAPHGKEVFDHPCVRRVGLLKFGQPAV
ncbi:MAG: cytochrome b5 domain-containing protein [Anaerolineales bacterium]|jgi:predicted heme/steroid binding protein